MAAEEEDAGGGGCHFWVVCKGGLFVRELIIKN